MPNVNYSNPNSLAIDTDYKPGGFLGGYLTSQKERDYREQYDLNNVMQNLNLMKQGAEFKDYLAEGPVRESRRGLDIAKNQALTPIQGTLAQGQGAVAQGQIDQTPIATSQKRFDLQKNKDEYLQDKVGDALNSIVGSNLPPAEQQMAWQRVIPMLEQESGMPVPQRMKQLAPEEMKQLADALTNDKRARQRMAIERYLEGGRNTRHSAEMNNRLKVAGVKADAQGNKPRTAAQEKADAHSRMKSALAVEKLNEIAQSGREPDVESVMNWTEIQATNAIYGGNPNFRADSAIRSKAAEVKNNMTRSEMRSAIPVTSAQDTSKIEVNQIFRTPNGKYYRKTGPNSAIELKFEEGSGIQQPRSTPSSGPISTPTPGAPIPSSAIIGR